MINKVKAIKKYILSDDGYIQICKFHLTFILININTCIIYKLKKEMEIVWILIDIFSFIVAYGFGFFYPLYASLSLINV